MDMVYFDCERLKYSGNGLYFFCYNLASALHRLSESEQDVELGFYVPKRFVGEWGCDCRYLEVNPIHKISGIFFGAGKIDLWHSAYQLTGYMPRGKRILQTVHDLNYLHEPLSEAQICRRRKIVEKNLRKVSRIVAISEATKRDILTHLDVGGIDIDVIYNGCNVYKGEVVTPVDAPKREFLYSVCTVLPKKNLHVLPCLLKGNDMDLVISGITPDKSYMEKIMEECRTWGVADRVHFTGSVAEPVKHWYLKNCKAFVFPSIAEGFGLPVVEAMQYGKPVFLSDYTSLPEIGGDCAYYFNHGFDRDAMCEEFANGIADYCSHEGKQGEIRSRAMSFSWDNAARRYIDVYRAMLSD